MKKIIGFTHLILKVDLFFFKKNVYTLYFISSNINKKSVKVSDCIFN